MNKFIKVKTNLGSTIYINPRFISLIEPNKDCYIIWMSNETYWTVPKSELDPYLEDKNIIQS